jgi:hypothetical protein
MWRRLRITNATTVYLITHDTVFLAGHVLWRHRSLLVEEYGGCDSDKSDNWNTWTGVLSDAGSRYIRRTHRTFKSTAHYTPTPPKLQISAPPDTNLNNYQIKDMPQRALVLRLDPATASARPQTSHNHIPSPSGPHPQSW